MNQSQPMQVLVSSETNEWYTPPSYIDAVRDVLGDIELDPASHPTAQAWINAERFYTVEDDGLSHPWVCRSLFLNPPYGKTGNQSNQDIWMRYLISQLPTIGSCIALTKTVPGYVWWDRLFNGAWPGHLCITTGRIAFIAPDGKTEGRSKAASSFWYYGNDPDRFFFYFSKLGRVLPPA